MGSVTCSAKESSISLGSCHAALIDKDDPRRTEFLGRDSSQHRHKLPLGILYPQETAAVTWADTLETGSGGVEEPGPAPSYPPCCSHREVIIVQPVRLGCKRRAQSEPDLTPLTKRRLHQDGKVSMSQKLAERAADYDEDHGFDVKAFLATQRLRGRVAAGGTGASAELPPCWGEIEADIEDVIEDVDWKILGIKSRQRELLDELKSNWASKTSNSSSESYRVHHPVRMRLQKEAKEAKGKASCKSRGSGSK